MNDSPLRQWMIVVGSPLDGLEFFGPFVSRKTALEFAIKQRGESGDWWVSSLKPPQELPGANENGDPRHGTPATGDSMDRIRHLLKMSHLGADGYGGQRLAAELAVQAFGDEWLMSHPTSPMAKAMRSKLRSVVIETTPSNYSNKDMVWKRFRSYAAAYSSRVANDAT